MIVLIDKKNRVIAFRGKSIFLSKKEFLLFELLAKNPQGNCIDNETIITYIWRDRCNGVTTQNIAQLTYLVRKKTRELPIDISHSKREGIYTYMNHRVFFLNCKGYIIKIIMKLYIYNKKSNL